MKTKLKSLLIILAIPFLLIPFILIKVHRWLYKSYLYRWIVESLTYPFWIVIADKSLEKASDRHILDHYLDIDSNNYWFKNQWYGKRYIKKVSDQVLSR